MTRAEVREMLGEIGLPCAYYRWEDDDPGRPEGPPFLCFYYARGRDFYADGENYAKIEELILERYADAVDLAEDHRIVGILNAHRLTCEWERHYIADQRMWVTVFRTEVNIEI